VAKAKCSVEFITGRGGPAAILYSKDGRAINAINYPRDTQFTPAKKREARSRLMRGCAELSRRR